MFKSLSYLEIGLDTIRYMAPEVFLGDGFSGDSFWGDIFWGDIFLGDINTSKEGDVYSLAMVSFTVRFSAVKNTFN